MRHVAAAEAKNKFGQLLDMAQKKPVLIDKKGRPVVVVMSVEEYERLEQLEDQLWAMKAKQAEKEGYLSEEESKKLMHDL